MTDLAKGQYSLPWEKDVKVVDGTSCDLRRPPQLCAQPTVRRTGTAPRRLTHDRGDLHGYERLRRVAGHCPWGRWRSSPSGMWRTSLCSSRPKLLPSPFKTMQSVWSNTASGELGPDFAQTVLRTLKAFAIAALAGIPIGIVVGLQPQRLQLRRVPCGTSSARRLPRAMFPLFMIIFAVWHFSKIAFAVCSMACRALNVAYGVMNARPTPACSPPT